MNRRQTRRQLAVRVDVVHLLLQDDRLLGQVAQTLGRFLGLFVGLTQLLIARKKLFKIYFFTWPRTVQRTHLLLVDGVRFLLVVQRRPEVAHAALCPRHQVVADGHLQGLFTVVLDVQGEGVLEEAQRQFVLSDGVQNQADVALWKKWSIKLLIFNIKN